LEFHPSFGRTMHAVKPAFIYCTIVCVHTSHMMASHSLRGNRQLVRCCWLTHTYTASGDLDLRKAIKSLRSVSLFMPANTMMVPCSETTRTNFRSHPNIDPFHKLSRTFMNFLGFSRYVSKLSSVHVTPAANRIRKSQKFRRQLARAQHFDSCVPK
jgi:hypothetical protein